MSNPTFIATQEALLVAFGAGVIAGLILGVIVVAFLLAVTPEDEDNEPFSGRYGD